MENSKSNQSDDYQNEQPENGSENSENPVATDLVSLEALVNVLIRNGICTAEDSKNKRFGRFAPTFL